MLHIIQQFVKSLNSLRQKLHRYVFLDLYHRALNKNIYLQEFRYEIENNYYLALVNAQEHIWENIKQIKNIY